MDKQRSGTRKSTLKGAHAECEGLWDWNLKSNRIHFSPGWISLVGCQDHEVGNTPEDWFQRVHPEDSDQLLRDIEAVRAEGPCDFDLRYRMRHKDGTYRWMSSRGLVVRNDAGEAIRLTGAQSDVTVETVTDPITGLPNRLLLLDRLSQSIERARRYSAFHFALLLIDVGRPAGPAPKSGPPVGDPLLNAAARRLETCLRSQEMMWSSRHHDLVARVKGDLLAVLLDGVKDLNHAKVVADHILVEMLRPFTLSGREARLSPTIGIALSATGYADPGDALRDAATALHRAQVLGGSHCEVFDTNVLKSEQADLQLEGDFESALQRREFELLYQPIVSLASNQVVGFEALVRWQHPVLGVISPLDFIPIAERTGFIVPLGRWILQEVCLRLSVWQTSLPSAKDLWVSVNLSGVQLRDPALIEHIGDALRDSTLEPHSLVLELTEGMAMENPTAVTTLLMQLRAMGIRMSIDDFGTGYSSLAYLRQFPVDALKIDQSFVRGMEIDQDTASIVATISTMASQLGLHVVAEGVENEDQLALLRSLNCELAQGYLFAEPLDADSAADLLQAGLPPRLETPRRAAIAGTSRREGQRPWHRRFPVAGRLLLVASVLTVLASSGVYALFRGWRPVRTSTAPPLQNALQKPAGGALAVSEAVAAPQKPQPPVPVRGSFDVVHLHRVGSCRGRLVVSRDGVAFVPAEKTGNDTFALKHAEFLHTLAGSTLTIKSATRSYRFMAAGANDHESLGTVVETIVRARPK